MRFLILQLRQISNSQFLISNKNLKLKIHLKIETGISRLGFSEEEWPELLKELKKLPKNIIVEGIYSHFASVEECDFTYAKKQVEKFKKFKKLLEKNSKSYTLSATPLYHLAASAATMVFPEFRFDMVRCGISIYGLWPSKVIKIAFETKNEKLKTKNQNLKFKTEFLKPVLSYKTKIIQIKKVEVGEHIGYGCTYQVKKPMTIAVIPVGYAEGFDRGFSNPSQAGNRAGEVLIKGIRCPVVGRVCMNMTVIDISPLRAKTGDEVVLIGKQGNKEITTDEWAEKLGTINYEITTRIPEHIKRIYIK